MAIQKAQPAPERHGGPNPGSLGRAQKTYPLMSRDEIESMIAKGRKIIIVDQHVLKVDAWLPYHPGGAKSILHMIGKDATDEVNWLGGSFRTAGECEPALAPAEYTPSTDPRSACSGSESRSQSISPVPIFDDENTGLGDVHKSPRRRRPDQRSESPCTTASSTSSVKGKDQEELDRIATSFLDVKTREEINLDLDKYPSLDTQTQQNIIHKYRELNQRIKAAGLYDCNYTAYAWEVARYTLLFVLMLVFLRMRWHALSGLCLGVFWHQLVFTAHDAGHMGITHSFHADTVIGIIIADFLGGLSICWWKDNHNVHHIVTNSPEHDPDIEHMPFFAVSHRLLGSLRSTYYDKIMEYDAAAKIFLSVQHYTYYLILCFGRFNLYRLSWIYIAMGLGPRKGPARWHRWLEAVGQVFFWTWFGYGVLYRGIDTNRGRFIFVMVSHVATMPLHVQITLSHFAMSTADLGPHESFPQRMLRTTMDVDCPQWLDFFHGGLQFQAIHHLYPRIPRHNLRKTQKLVQEFCNDVGIPYALYGFLDGNKEVIGRLADVSKQATILAQCQQALFEGRA
ncbi:fatty acid desaturase [Ophiostoma piceae UAMH 11346]|uniref:Delta 8-(E)-sphingolipid desaturase n=1 Tax=Ophiostoma piceae (strain UAMH 11346) TaxID=1262450 RepID=S3BWA5_OPHP1|nr:fatty acid desaturase [Ophiostoma piceae UAMH 11346]